MRTFKASAMVAGGSVLVSLGLVGCATSGGGSSYRGTTLGDYAIIDGKKVPVPNIPMGDRRTVAAIIDEGKYNSQVMDHLKVLTDELGPRLTGSSMLDEANDWSVEQFKKWGIHNAREEYWGDIATRFDRGPSTAKIFLPGDEDGRDMQGFSTLAWVMGTDGPERGPAVPMPESIEEFNQDPSRYSNAWVMFPPDYSGRRGVRGGTTLLRERHEGFKSIREGGDLEPSGLERPLAASDDRFTGTYTSGDTSYEVVLDLTLENGQITGGYMDMLIWGGEAIDNVEFNPQTGALSFTWREGRAQNTIEGNLLGARFTGKAENPGRGTEGNLVLTLLSRDQAPSDAGPSLTKMVLDQEPLGFVSSSLDSRVWTSSKSNWREIELADYGRDTEVSISEPDYDFIKARMAAGIDVELEFDLNHTLVAGPIPQYNVIAEIVGTEKPDEVVIMSAHIDSWDGPGSVGVVDNGTGTAVTLEAARILAAVGANPKRTIRFILWTGEEQGLIGSREYVNALTEEERSKISAVFVDDGGTNYQGGLRALPSMVPILAAASAPMNGVFTSEPDRIAQLNDDNPDNDWSAGLLNVNIRTLDAERLPRGGGSDHASFNNVGVPGFFWDETGRANYRYAWHTQNDKYDQAIPEYLAMSATNTAVVLYNLANAPTLLPRTNGADVVVAE